ncbi:hypothetical protein PHYSODRAFT_302703 [Phytophthora sojae]|uniref:Uncharacterized protein n=1 Tax=Phytophthora sojae (strain P6497) TaxID=1094619 RepID=G4ZT35_PHYSP|nr:hypothetical protein PHYSODRAFT_302703 [Phytophthora sojae]EGZ12852.1 hypothetical protein PHYSODRAFT_302703 [Phytophthora sojae]|eukprot:XP_009530281.1 hypothetical protein PHYSODRAFT_302703 [Phytophthora sojae]
MQKRLLRLPALLTFPTTTSVLISLYEKCFEMVSNVDKNSIVAFNSKYSLIHGKRPMNLRFVFDKEIVDTAYDNIIMLEAAMIEKRDASRVNGEIVHDVGVDGEGIDNICVKAGDAGDCFHSSAITAM